MSHFTIGVKEIISKIPLGDRQIKGSGEAKTSVLKRNRVTDETL